MRPIPKRCIVPWSQTKSHFDLGPQLTINTILVPQNGARTLGRLLRMEGAVLAADDPAAALDRYVDMIRLGRTMEPRGGAVCHLVSAELEGNANRNMQSLLSRPSVPPNVCRRTITELDRLAAKQMPAAEWIKMEFITVISTIDNAEQVIREVREERGIPSHYRPVWLVTALDDEHREQLKRMCAGLWIKVLELLDGPNPAAACDTLLRERLEGPYPQGRQAVRKPRRPRVHVAAAAVDDNRPARFAETPLQFA